MNGEADEPVDEGGGAEPGGGADTLIDILTGQAIPVSPKNTLVQKVLRQLVGSYGFDRANIRTRYGFTTPGKRGKTADIAIVFPDGLLGNLGDEYVRWWILRHCEVLASIDLLVDPFKVTLKDYRLTSATPSLEGGRRGS